MHPELSLLFCTSHPVTTSGMLREKISDIMVLAIESTPMPVQATDPNASQICQNCGVRMTVSICTLFVVIIGFACRGQREQKKRELKEKGGRAREESMRV